jgi:DedD protein
MDQGLKERLVGAAVLVAIGVWLIPWVLDGPETPIENSPSSLQLPAAEEPVPMRTQTLRIGADAEEPTVAEAAPAPAEPAVVAAVPAEPEPAVEPPVAPVAAAPAQPAVAATPPAAAPRPATAAPAPAAKGDWVVQLGSFGAEDNARALARRADQFGYRAGVSTTRANGRTLYRVRVGPYEGRREAEAAASALGAHGLKGQVVAAD